jgi:hypothetical protein
MSVAAAAGKLSGLVKGSLIGIVVTKHDGASPRVVTAAVVGTGGRTTVSGGDLEGRFALMSTLARFTTITTNAGTVAKSIRRLAHGHSPYIDRITAQTASAVSAYVHQLFAPGTADVYGTIFPGPNGAALLVQRLAGGHWHTVRHAQLSSGGRYSVPLPGAGSYRVSFSGLAGPTVSAS